MIPLSRIFWIPFILIIFTSSTVSALEVDRIKISVMGDHWYKRSAPILPAVQIERKQDGYFICFPVDSKNCTQRVDRSLVERLVKAASLPPLKHLDISRLGITQEGLNSRVLQAYKTKKRGLNLEGRWTGERCEPPLCSGPDYKQTFIKNFTDMAEVDYELKSYFYSLIAMHGGAGFRVSLVFQNGDTWFLTSFNQHHFFLPWTVQRSGKRFETYAPEIARAVHDLLPETHFKSEPNNKRDEALYALQFNRKSLESDPYQIWLEELLAGPVLRDLKILKAFQALGAKTKIIQSQFKILKMSIEGSDSKGRYDLSGLWEKKRVIPKVKIDIAATISLKNSDDVEKLVEQTNARVQRVLNVEWFRDWLEQNKSNIDHLKIDLTRPGKIYETVDMAAIYLKKYKYKTWVSKIKKQRDEMISITVDHEAWPIKDIGKFTRWLVFPNGEMVLWVTNMEQVHTWNRSKYGFQFTKAEAYYGRDGIINHIAHFDSQGHMTVHYRDPSGPCYLPPPFKKYYSYGTDCLKK